VATAIRPPDSALPQGFYAQAKSVAEYAAIFINTGSTPTLKVGEKFNVVGYYTGDGVGLGQLVSIVSITPTGTTDIVTSTSVTDPATIATGGGNAEKYESMLTHVNNVSVTVMNADTPNDWDEFKVTGVLRVDDELSPTLGNDYDPLTTPPFPKLAGVLTYSYSNHKLLPLIPVEAVRNPQNLLHPPLGTSVTLRDMYVTAIAANGSYVGFNAQDVTRNPFTGIFVYTATPPSVAVGNRVNVKGNYGEFFTQGELNGNPVVTITSTSTSLPFAPLVVLPGSIATFGADAEKYESMLLQVNGVAVADVNPDVPSDYDEFKVDSGLRVDDLLFPSLNNNYALGTTFTKIVGVHAFTFSNHKLEPRSASDIVTP
jgi:hypothetical protein